MKFAIKLSISSEIAVSRENLGKADNFFPTWRTGCLGGMRKFCKNVQSKDCKFRKFENFPDFFGLINFQ